MDTIAVLMVFSGALLIRQTAKGRARDILTDAGDFITAALSGDYESLSEIAARPPSETSSADSGSSGSSTGTVAPDASPSGAAVLDAARTRGAKATYGWGKTGPSEYDCSGLVWRSMQDVGYQVGRFTTSTFGVMVAGPGLAKKLGADDAPQVGDLVLWTGKHIGIVSGSDLYYSALNEESGIKETSIKGMGGAPVYYRLTGKTQKVKKTVPVRPHDGNIPQAA